MQTSQVNTCSMSLGQFVSEMVNTPAVPRRLAEAGGEPEVKASDLVSDDGV